MSTSKPSLVFVHGAWHTAETWTKVCPLLEAQGYKTVAVSLPSTKGDPSIGYGDDIRVTRDAITGETSQGRDVVVVVHSYGGFVGGSAIKGLTKPKTSEDASSAEGHVLGLVLLTTGFTKSGCSFMEAMGGGGPPPSFVLDTEKGFATLVVDPRELFYHDLPEAEGQEWVSKLKPHSLRTLTHGGEHAYEGWRDVPVWYLCATADRALDPEAQKMLIQLAQNEGADLTVREIDSSHSPMLSKPRETVEFIVEAVAAMTK